MKVYLFIEIFGQPITLAWLVSILLALWEFIGRVIPTWKQNPPTALGWIIEFLSWLSKTLNNTK
jgi:hypothetical protein